ncbi:MAG: hypothetical protein Q7T71_01675, partial [Herbiconiux sp.]|nr:hypothetical protein [Herbiconiux sp.]
VLRERDVAFVVRTPFEVLRDVREDDLVLLDPDFGRDARTEREMRSFAGSATARGALVIAPSPRGVQADLYGSWPGFARVGAHPETDAVWGNGPLVRRLRADAP